ncbi:MAG: succinate dehydrogenase assembly factor 2 [Granulosicoccaceae bacterium]
MTTRSDTADDKYIAKLKWRSRRGMRELDRAMLAYLDNHYKTATATEQNVFEQLLNEQDPFIFSLLNQRIKDERYQTIMDKIATTLRD